MTAPTPTSPNPANLLQDPLHLLALGFGAGCLKPGPGTWGSVIGIAVYFLVRTLSLPVYVLIVVLAFGLGVWICGRTAVTLGVADHPSIVWDEVVGVLITLAAAPGGWRWWVAGFLLFRLLDIAKPWPVRWVDRHVHGGLGIMLDDAVAGVMACLVLQVIAKVAV
ncbi:MAG: phosphatidylglycerophosphatase A [Gammaproteobacteria bacterium]